MSSKFVGYGKKLFDLVKSQGDKGSKTSTTIVGTTPKIGSLTKRREDTEAIFRARQRHGVSPNKNIAETVKKVSKLNDEIDAIRNKTSKAKGGRIGLNLRFAAAFPLGHNLATFNSSSF